MCRRLICLISFVLLLSLVSGSSAELVGHWEFDEGSGTLASDSSDRGNNGTLGGAARWDAGFIGGAVYLDGSSWVDIPSAAWGPIERQVTVAFWAFGGQAMPVNHFAFAAYSADDNNARQASGHVPWSNGNVYWDTGWDGTSYDRIFTALPAEYHKGQWVHWAFTKNCDTGQVYIYVNGKVFHSGTGMTHVMTGVNAFTIGVRATSDHAQGYIGWIDDFRLYDRALTAAEIKVLATPPIAHKPTPTDGAIYENKYASCQWSPNAYATSHDVYFGDNFDDVNDGTGGTFRGNLPLATTYFIVGFAGYDYPDGLVPGTTYYWRIDEVNDLNPDSPWKGDVWSFTIPSEKAYKPVPPDGTRFVDTDVTLTWTKGFGAVFHYLYFGDNAADVEAGTGGTDKGQLVTASFVPGPLERDKNYFWRVDESDGTATHTGDVWSFRTMPEMPITDPNLVAWWKLDEGSGSMALDWSGHEHHATIGGTPDFVPGYDGDALDFDGSTDYIDVDERLATGIYSLTMWIRPRDIPYSSGYYAVMHNDAWNAGSLHLHLRNTTSLINADINAGPGVESTTALQADQWYHCALTVTTEAGNASQLYINGVLESTGSGGTGTPYLGPLNFGAWTNNQRFYHGLMDDIRIYDKVLTADEVQQIMRGDPLLAWNPSPPNGSVPDIHEATPISWSPGDEASQHDVYFGTDRNVVTDADTSTTGIYRGRQSATSYTPPEGVEWGGGPYYWRIDEYNTDGTINTGRVWSFSVADFIAIDDFEDYKGDEVPVTEQIWGKWLDGLGFGAPGAPPYNPGNGTGAEVGDGTTDSYTEETIYHGGFQSMPYLYDNNKQGYFKYSEAKMTLTAPRDWSDEGVKALSLWFRGYPAPVGSFVEAPAGTYTITATGADIWGTADQFHFAFKQLTGAGTITAKVESVENTNGWAKACVMIRDTLDAGSVHGMMCVTPTQGVAFQRRTTADAASTTTTTAGIPAPQWVKIERDLGGNVTASYSADAIAWTQVETELITMNTPVYIGLALTSHDNSQTCEAVFSNVTITGNVGAVWAHQDIGIASNAAEPMYVAIANKTGQPAVVYHDDPAAAQIDTWTEWPIDLKEFADKGINLADVNSIAIGFGDRDNPVAGGTGKMYFDDIALHRPRCVPDKVTLSAADLNGDCIVDFADLELMVGDWLAADAGLAADLNADGSVDFKDYAALAEAWLDEQLWPVW